VKPRVGTGRRRVVGMTGAGPARRVALVTGAGQGIGAAIAARMAAGGHRVAVCDVRPERAERTARAIDSAGRRATAVAADVSDAASVAAMVAAVTRSLGAPGILVNNAGVISAAPFAELAEAEWDRVLGVNLKGQYLCAQAVLPAMRGQGWGRIINIASDAGKTGEPYLAHYCASKFGVIGLTQSLALEYAREGITVNAVCPAITDTDMMEQLAQEMQRSGAPEPAAGWRAAFVQEIPLGRPMAPADIAELCAFLATDGAAAISGQAINVSGAHEVH
jgi:meso-butanediol dehydrogenase/(S,S)-butanediol dehydrogenase/diacetyl reductase